MYYTEYGQAAIKHYQSVQHMFDVCFSHAETDLNNADHDILYRIYYLCGHIIECVAIYWIYKQFQWEINPYAENWKGMKADINFHSNPYFTERSRLDFDKVKVVGNTLEFKRGSKIRSTTFVTKRAEKEFMHISGHGFQKYIEQIIVPGNFVQAPFFRQMEVDDENYAKGINLLNWWQPDIRYYYEGRVSHFNYNEFKKSKWIGIKVDIDSVYQLLEICRIATRTIVHTPKVRQLLPPSA